MTMINVWDKHLLRAAEKETSALSGVRRIISGLKWEWEVSDLHKLPITFPDLGYASKASKMRQLDKNYYNPESWDRALQLLDERGSKKVSAITVSLNSVVKDSRSQGFCMSGGVMFRQKDFTELTVFYRSTELFQKHTADLLWFRERLPPCVSKIRFMAASAYMSALFFPIYARFSPNPVRLIKLLDPPSLRVIGGGIRPFLRETHNYTYKHRVKMWNYFHNHVSPEKFKALAAVCPKRQVDLDEEEDE
jgi:hypothetical protein